MIQVTAKDLYQAQETKRRNEALMRKMKRQQDDTNYSDVTFAIAKTSFMRQPYGMMTNKHTLAAGEDVHRMGLIDREEVIDYLQQKEEDYTQAYNRRGFDDRYVQGAMDAVCTVKRHIISRATVIMPATERQKEDESIKL